MRATYGWIAPGRLPRVQDIRLTPPRTGVVSRSAPLSIQLARWCPLFCLAPALLTKACCASAMPAQESSQQRSATAMSGGPFPVRSLSPIQLLYFQFTPERAMALPRGSWQARFDLAEANYLARDERRADAFLFDFELTRANLALQYGLFDRLTVGLEVPLLYTWKGFLDEPIKLFEDVTGFKPTIRFERPQHLFSDFLQKDGAAVLEGMSGAVGLGASDG